MARRFGLYFFGVLMGIVMVYFMFLRNKEDNTYIQWTPNERIKEQFRQDLGLRTRNGFDCLLNCQGVSEEEFDLLLKDGDAEIDGPAGERDTLFYTIELERFNKPLIQAEFQWVRKLKQGRLLEIQKGDSTKQCDC